MDKYSMIIDIIEGDGIEDERIKDAMRVCYFRGLSHCDDKDRILAQAFDNTFSNPTKKGE
ncbi:MAG: hypothetical protein ACI9N9_001207 [Enterobacterales bacterium]|jgi:hypothetical protein